MVENHKESSSRLTSRRQFLKTSSLIASVSGAAAATLGQAAPVHAGGTDLMKVGLIGCGGRGTGAILNALQADENLQVTAPGRCV